MKQIYAVVELGRLVDKVSKVDFLNFDIYTDLEGKHEKLLDKYFGVNICNFIVTPELINCFVKGGPNQPYAEQLLTYSEFKRFEEELTFEEKLELAKDLLEIDMAYKAKQKELNEKGVYIHFHEIMSFHRKFMQALTG